ncbi:MAG: cytochrome c [Planctomycetota bacterium]|nr:cytochrome c [Planctomycetota bacterium]
MPKLPRPDPELLKTLKTPLLVVFGLALVVFAVLGWRGRESGKPPVQFWNDMADQNKWKPQSATSFYADGRTARMPVDGTVPWGQDVQTPDPVHAQVASELYALEQGPLPVDRTLLARGKAVYANFCTLCHGAAGDGQGVTTQYGMNNPPAYTLERLRGATDGYLFKIITEGKGQMAPLAGRIPVDDRWAAVAWLRVLMRAGHASLDDVPEAARKELQ